SNIAPGAYYRHINSNIVPVSQTPFSSLFGLPGDIVQSIIQSPSTTYSYPVKSIVLFWIDFLRECDGKKGVVEPLWIPDCGTRQADDHNRSYQSILHNGYLSILSNKWHCFQIHFDP